MSDPHDTLLGQCAGYALEMLDPEERMQFEEHLRTGCGECHALLRELNDAAVLLASSAPSEEPPAVVKTRILETIRAERASAIESAAPTRADRAGAKPSVDSRWPERDKLRPAPARVDRIAPWTRWIITGLAAACVVLSFDAARLRRERAALESQLTGVRTQLVQLEAQLGEQTKWAELVSSPGTQFAVLSATPDGNAEQVAWAMIDPRTRRAVVGIDAARAPQGHDYELWAIQGGTPRSLGLIHADEQGRAVVHVEDVGGTGKVEALAVSLERTGGSLDPNRPSGPVVLVGAIRG